MNFIPCTYNSPSMLKQLQQLTEHLKQLGYKDTETCMSCGGGAGKQHDWCMIVNTDATSCFVAHASESDSEFATFQIQLNKRSTEECFSANCRVDSFDDVVRFLNRHSIEPNS